MAAKTKVEDFVKSIHVFRVVAIEARLDMRVVHAGLAKLLHATGPARERNTADMLHALADAAL